MNEQSDSRPMVTFPAVRRQRPLDGTILYCLVTEERVWTTCLKVEWPRVKLRPSHHWSNALKITLPGHTTGGCPTKIVTARKHIHVY